MAARVGLGRLVAIGEGRCSIVRVSRERDKAFRVSTKGKATRVFFGF